MAKDVFSSVVRFIEFPNLLTVERVDRYEKIDTHSITEQDAITEIPSLIAMFDGKMADLFVKFNNKCVYESTLGGVFVDQLNPSEVAEFQKRRDALAKQEEALAKSKQEFEAFKAWQATQVLNRTVPVPPAGDSAEAK